MNTGPNLTTFLKLMIARPIAPSPASTNFPDIPFAPIFFINPSFAPSIKPYIGYGKKAGR